jgi:hypothetical protein
MTAMNWAKAAKTTHQSQQPAPIPLSKQKTVPEDAATIISTLETNLFFMTTRQREFALNCFDQNDAYGGLSLSQWTSLRDLPAKVKRLASLNPLMPTK